MLSNSHLGRESAERGNGDYSRHHVVLTIELLAQLNVSTVASTQAPCLVLSG